MSNMNEEKEKNVIPSKVHFYGPLGHLNGMWKRRQYKAIRDLCRIIPQYYFDAGIKAERERIGKILADQYLTESMWKELFPDEQERGEK